MEIYKLKNKTGNYVMMAVAVGSCGEPSDISNELEKIDLNEVFTGGNGGVYIIRAAGDSMEADIRNGDLLIVNRNFAPQSGDVVLASINDSLTIKIFKPFRNGLQLVASNKKYQPRDITSKDDFEVFGVVTDVIHKLKKI